MQLVGFEARYSLIFLKKFVTARYFGFMQFQVGRLTVFDAINRRLPIFCLLSGA
jgi:hypothetical protein